MPTVTVKCPECHTDNSLCVTEDDIDEPEIIDCIHCGKPFVMECALKIKRYRLVEAVE